MAGEAVFFKEVVDLFIELFIEDLGWVWGLGDGGLRGQDCGGETHEGRDEEGLGY